MRRTLLLLVGASLLLAADQPQDEASKKDLARMQGDWVVVSFVRDGEKIPDDDAQALFRTVKGNEYSVSRYDKVVGTGTFTVDATKKPRTIDSLPRARPGAKATPLLGIYEFDGEKLRTCYGAPGKDRPTAFESKEGSGWTLTVWEREKK
jgi:uncharacterized protein (TIGR03067 family)